MWPSWKALAGAALVVSSIFSTVSAQSQSNNASTYIYTSGPNNLTFTITVNPENSDVWFWMAGPSSYSWIAVGIGSGMGQASMFIAYQGTKDNTVTLSGRKSKDEVEPSYDPSMFLSTIKPSNEDPTISNGYYLVGGHCSNCTFSLGLNPAAKQAPFIWAVGPEYHGPRSDAMDAPLRRHTMYGTFQLDMTQAHGTAAPTLGLQTVGVSGFQNPKSDHEFSSSGHAFAMGLAFAIIFPLGVFFLRILQKVNLHMYAQTFGSLLVIIGTISGFVVSRSYNRSKSFSNPHQIVGIVVFLLIIAQWVFGFLHHRAYKRTSQPTWMIKPHKFLIGPIVMVVGIINAAFGFKFALAPQENLFYVPIVILVIILMIVSFFAKNFFARRRRNKNVPFGGPMPTESPFVPPGAGYAPGAAPAYTPDRPYQGGYESTSSNIALANLGDPPSYTQQPQKPREFA